MVNHTEKRPTLKASFFSLRKEIEVHSKGGEEFHPTSSKIMGWSLSILFQYGARLPMKNGWNMRAVNLESLLLLSSDKEITL